MDSTGLKYYNMKKMIIAVLVMCTLSITASAQTKKEAKTKVEHTSTVPQKVHNVIHHKHKRYSGYKTKRKKTTK